MGSLIARFTLYDIVGQLLPGLCALHLAAFTMAAFGIEGVGGSMQLTPGGFWDGAGVLALAYVAGHVVQAVSAQLFPKVAKIVASQGGLAEDETQIVKDEIVRRGLAIGDAYLVRLEALKIPFPEREIFVARQGFYRGFLLPAIVGVIVMAIAGLAGRRAAFAGVVLYGWRAGVGALTCLVVAALFARRYAQFVGYELRYAIAELIRRRSQLA